MGRKLKTGEELRKAVRERQRRFQAKRREMLEREKEASWKEKRWVEVDL